MTCRLDCACRLVRYSYLDARTPGKVDLGFGSVYRARDARLGRDVAIKVLPASFAENAQSMARFKREAQALASLNHPGIASIFGLEESNGIRGIVMESVEGDTLADRLRRGAMPLEEALNIAKQVAEALEYAHDRGIIHRDLKPANVKVTPDGKVKLLDFGLAKAAESDSTTSDISSSPTLSAAATQAGIILGTAAYMSPEQAKGKFVDRRADIWAFCVLLFEIVTDKPLYAGETTSEILARVIEREPDLNQLPASMPGPIRELMRPCLTKNPRQRLRDIGEANCAGRIPGEPGRGANHYARGNAPGKPAANEPIAVAVRRARSRCVGGGYRRLEGKAFANHPADDALQRSHQLHGR